MSLFTHLIENVSSKWSCKIIWMSTHIQISFCDFHWKLSSSNNFLSIEHENQFKIFVSKSSRLNLFFSPFWHAMLYFFGHWLFYHFYIDKNDEIKE
jgi:hypothetical protein